MTFRVNTLNNLPGKLCYDLWAKQRKSLYQIPFILANEHDVRNKRTGGLVTPQGVERAAWLYALEHLEEAKIDTVSIMSQSGKVVDDAVWNAEIISKARRFYSQKKYRRFLAIHPELKKYAEESS